MTDDERRVLANKIAGLILKTNGQDVSDWLLHQKEGALRKACDAFDTACTIVDTIAPAIRRAALKEAAEVANSHRASTMSMTEGDVMATKIAVNILARVVKGEQT